MSDEFGDGIVESVVNNILARYNIKPEDIDKVKSIIDRIDVSKTNYSTIIEINLKKIKIVIDN